MATETIASSVLGKIVDSLFDASGRHLGYLLHYNDNIEKLKKQVKKLVDMRDRLQGKIDLAYRNGEIIEADVQTWVAEVNSITADAEKFLDDEVKANQRCLKGWCINLRSCYRLSKEAKQRNEAIDQLKKESNFEEVSRPAPPPEIIHSSEGFYVTSDSRELIKEEIMDALKNDSVSIIGLCGMGGVGKTTIVKEIIKKAKEDKLYDAVVMAVVSQTPTIMKIQKKIATMLGLALPEDDQSASAGSLWQRIKREKRILVVLDDIWGRIELHEIGIPFGNDHKGCTVMLTSRSQGVCNEMDAKIFRVETLSEQESWILFKQAAGLNDDDSINLNAIKVAAECGGLPIAILTLGRALKSKDKYVWTHAARHLKNSTPTNIEGMEKNVFSSLELSYNYLESEEAKSVFLFCSLYPEDSYIPVEGLVRYGIGLRWFKEVDAVEDARLRVHSLVSTLTSSFLLITENERIKMHDVIRDFALAIAPKYEHIFIVKAGMGLDNWPTGTFHDLTGFSLMKNRIPALPDGLECPKLQVLLFQNSFEDRKIPNSFFQGMKEVKVLDLSDNYRLSSLPPSLSLLTSLRTLHLNDCGLVDVSPIVKLTNLEILDLSFSLIKKIPKDFGLLTHLKLLNLRGCSCLKLIPYGVISCLGKLEELNMTKSFTRWDSGSNAKLVELQSLSRLSSLQIRIPRGLVLPCDKPFQNLTRFDILIGFTATEDELPSRSITVDKTYSKLTLIYDHGIIHDAHIYWVKNLLKRTENLLLWKIIDSENFFRDQLALTKGFSELKCLTLECCRAIKHLLNTLEWRAQTTFRNLETLTLIDNPSLVEICHGQLLPAKCFSKLQKLLVWDCCSMLNIVPSHLLQRLQNLRSCQAYACKSLVHVFDFEGLEIVNEETKFLSLLRILHLENLPEMMHIWKGDTKFLSLCNLQSVKLGGCEKLKTLFPPVQRQSLTCLEDLLITACDDLEEVFGKTKAEDGQENEIVLWKKDHTMTSPTLRNLSSIYIDHCNKLKNIFAPSIARSLELLKKLTISSCSSMQEIIIDDNEGASTETIVFPTLHSICLSYLENLTCFCSASCTIEFPALEDLKIISCQKMETFGYGNQATPKLKTVQQSYRNDEGQWTGNLNDTVKKLFKEQAMVQNQEALPKMLPLKLEFAKELVHS